MFLRWRAIAVLVLSGACSRAASDGPTSALLITLDTTRADALQEALTPNLEHFAADAIRFERAYTVTPLTLPAHASMMSGLYPVRHGLRNNGARRLSSEAETLAERAQEVGFQTAAFISAAVLDGAFGLNQGFDVYDSPPLAVQQVTTEYSSRRGSEIVSRALDWLAQRDRKRPFFLWVHIWDPHGPYDPPAEFRDIAPQHPYLGEVAAADKAVGQLLTYLKEDGIYNRTTVLIVADHGEAFWEHGEFSHGSYCWDTTMRVPLMLRSPGDGRNGQRVQAIASVADVHPTLAAAMELPPTQAQLDGQNLLDPIAPDRGVYFESYYGYLAYGWSPLTGWVDERGKYLHSSQPIFFDAQKDPKEERPRVAADATYDSYRRAIGEISDRSVLTEVRPEKVSGLDEEIEQLGYAQVEQMYALPHPLSPSSAPSPHGMVDEQKLTLEAQKYFNTGDYAECKKIHARILAENPRNMHSWSRMGICLIRQRRHQEAIPALERVYSSDRVTASAAVNLGVCMRVAERTERAIECFERALAIDGSHAQAVRHLIDLYETLGNGERAASHRRRYRELTGQSLPPR
jgi:arylsulfatase A-like enzyme